MWLAEGQVGEWEIGDSIIIVADFPFILGKVPPLWFFISKMTSQLRTYGNGQASQGELGQVKPRRKIHLLQLHITSTL